MVNARSGARRPEPAGVLPGLTGVAAAFGLSAIGTIGGGLAVSAINRADIVSDRFVPALWVMFAAAGTVAAGATVADIAGRQAWRSIAIAGGLLFLAVFEIMRSIETTGAEGVELQMVVAVALVYTALLAVGVQLHHRRATR